MNLNGDSLGATALLVLDIGTTGAANPLMMTLGPVGHIIDESKLRVGVGRNVHVGDGHLLVGLTGNLGAASRLGSLATKCLVL